MTGFPSFVGVQAKAGVIERAHYALFLVQGEECHFVTSLLVAFCDNAGQRAVRLIIELILLSPCWRYYDLAPLDEDFPTLP
jgi:hypothetical protein